MSMPRLPSLSVHSVSVSDRACEANATGHQEFCCCSKTAFSPWDEASAHTFVLPLCRTKSAYVVRTEEIVSFSLWKELS